ASREPAGLGARPAPAPHGGSAGRAAAPPRHRHRHARTRLDVRAGEAQERSPRPLPNHLLRPPRPGGAPTVPRREAAAGTPVLPEGRGGRAPREAVRGARHAALVRQPARDEPAPVAEARAGGGLHALDVPPRDPTRVRARERAGVEPAPTSPLGRDEAPRGV